MQGFPREIITKPISEPDFEADTGAREAVAGVELLRILSLYSGLHDYASVESFISSFESALKESGLTGYYLGAFTALQESLRARNAVVFVATGGTSGLGYRLLRDVENVYVVYHEEHNSLASALNLASMLKHDGKRVRMLSMEAFSGVALKLSRALAGLERVYGGKILVVGSLQHWSQQVGVSSYLKKHFGVELELVELEALLKEAAEVSLEDSEAHARELVARAEEVRVGFQDVVYATSIYLALKKIAESRRASNVALRCFDLLKALGRTGCIAVAELIREGIIAGCEADVAATVVMRVLREIAGRDPWVANVSGLWDRELELSHCVISRSITKSYRLVTHFESGKATSIEGIVEEGLPATIVSYDPPRSLWRVIEARVTRGSPASSRKCRTQVRLQTSPQAIKEILEDPIEGHYVAVFSNVVEEASLAGELAGLNVQTLKMT
ncbi:MAG: hypothetical protein QXS85_05940 [Acidilobaceae archaeon]